MNENNETVDVNEELKSNILSDDEIANSLASDDGSNINSDIPEDEVTLPSDEEEFVMPDKFKGKSAEEIAKSYIELEKMRQEKLNEENNSNEDNDSDISDDVDFENMEADELDKYIEELETDINNDTNSDSEKFAEFREAYEKNGSLSDEQYAKLEEMGVSREDVDAEIEWHRYQQEKSVKAVVEPLGGGIEKFKEVVAWAQANKTEAEITAFNEALAGSSIPAQQILLKGLYSEFDSGSSNNSDDGLMMHTNAPQTTGTKGYATESEFMKDISSEAYKTDKSYVKAVERKLAASNTEDWSF